MGTLDNSSKNFDISLSFGEFRNEGNFFDVTLAADSSNGSVEALRAHKLILSACSPVLRSLLKEQSRFNGNSQTMPVMLYLRGISARGLNHVLDFVYKGSISLDEEELNDFLAVSECLQIPLMEGSKPSPAKRALSSNNSKKSKRARVQRKKDGIEQGLPERDPSFLSYDSLDGITIKPDPGTLTVNEDMHEEDFNPDLYEGNIDLDDSKEGNAYDEAAVEPEHILGSKHELAKNAADSDGGQEDVERNGREYILAEIQEGNRRGSVNYLIRDKLFLKASIYKNTVLAKCTKKLAGCRGSATICKDTLMVLRETAHTCGTDQTDVEILHLKNKMKNMAEEETSLSVRQIFDEVSSENPEVAAKISFPKMESAMSKRRSRL